jgi:hypothetical protein
MLASVGTRATVGAVGTEEVAGRIVERLGVRGQ